MTKLLIEVFTPSNGKTYEFQLDGGMTVGQAATQMINTIREAENETVEIGPGTAILGDINTSRRLNASVTLLAAGVKSGHRLILV